MIAIMQKQELAYLVCRDEVPDEQQDAHDDVLSDGDNVRSRYFEHLYSLLHRCIQVDVV